MPKACPSGLKNRKLLRFEIFFVPALLLAGIAGAALPALAEHTRWWRQSAFEEFDKGTAKGVALRSDGKLLLAPHFAELADANLAYLLTLRADAKGNLYAGGGSNAKVLRYDAGGKPSTVFESSELSAQALALDSAGNLFVGTSPDGKVYKVTPSGQSSVFFDPKTKYIWDLAVDKDGTVYVATGDTGKIFVVAPDGKGQIFYSSGETHIRSIALDTNGNVLAGTEPSGQVLRIPKGANPRAFVLYETAKREITALQQDASGNLYVAAVGEKNPVAPAIAPAAMGGGTAVQTFSMPITTGQTNAVTPIAGQPGQIIPFQPFPQVTSSSVYRIALDGSPEELWSSRDEVVYALAFAPGGKLLLGTGNQGAVMELDGQHVYSRLVKAVSRQVTSIAAGPGGKLYLASANPGKVFTLGPELEPEGTFESQAFDAHIFSHWGRLEWWSETAAPGRNAGAARIEFFARSGNTTDPENNWSAWSGPYSNIAGDKLDCPPARFLQWKVVLRGGNSGTAPEVDWVNVAYLPKNVAPDVTAIAVQAPGVRVQGLSMQVGTGGGTPVSVQLRMPQPPAQSSSASIGFGGGQAAASAGTIHFDSPPQGFSQKGFDSVLWTAEDSNDDQLEFSVYFRGENETSWKLLKDHLDTKFYTWDTTTMPDGAYYLKIVASDAPSNPEGDELTSERESDRFVVANTPPSITQLTAEPAGSGGARVRFQANASATFISRAQYSLDAGDWVLVFPSGGLSDAQRENYDFQIKKIAPGDHIVTVRVYDEFDNVTSAKTTVRGAAGGN